MLTDEQMQKAREALQERKSEELKRRVMLHLYRQDQENARRWKLPFKMVHRKEYPSEETAPNDYYPHRSGIIIDGSGKPAKLPDAEKLTEEAALYYFTRLLVWNEECLKDYRNADWTGEAITTAEAAEIRETYLKRIRDYKEHPERYDTQPHRIDGTGERYFLPNEV